MTSFLAKYQTIMISVLAAVGYGLWAVFANFEHGIHAWSTAGIVQALYAFFATLSVSKVAHWIFLKCKCGLRGISLGFVASFIVMLAFPFSIHSVAGTPDIWETITPGLILGSFYLMGYLISLDWTLRILPERKKSAK